MQRKFTPEKRPGGTNSSIIIVPSSTYSTLFFSLLLLHGTRHAQTRGACLAETVVSGGSCVVEVREHGISWDVGHGVLVLGEGSTGVKIRFWERQSVVDIFFYMIGRL
jgi:hypothetical protein